MVSSHAKLRDVSESTRLSREGVLIVSFLLLIGLFIFTAFFSRMYKKHVHVLADGWVAHGQTDYQAANYPQAEIDFRNALAYSPDNRKLQFQLAKALAGDGREDEAKAYLQTLLSESPGSGEINLELARVAVKQNQASDALMYFQGAIYGAWEGDAIAKRWDVRKEFCEYLMKQGDLQQVEGELITLVDNTPKNDKNQLNEAGELLLRAQLWKRALSVFQSVLILNKQDAEALEGAGRSAYQLGDYFHALEYFDHLPPEKRSEAGVSEMQETSRLFVELNPFRSGLSLTEKVEKTERALRIAQARLQQCAGYLGGWNALPANAGNLQALKATGQSNTTEWSAPSLQRHSERIEPAVAWATEVERETAPLCGTPQGENYALWLLGRTLGGGGK